MYEIAITNQQDFVPIDEAFLREVAQRTLAEERVASAEVSIALVDNPAIRHLNRQYLDRDEATDVLSFVLACEEPEKAAEGRAELPRGAGKRLEGEVILSGEAAAETAGKFHWSSRDEIVLYLVHGLLHLAGYDDLSEDERRTMRARERRILGLWSLTPRYESHCHGGPSPAADRGSGADS